MTRISRQHIPRDEFSKNGALREYSTFARKSLRDLLEKKHIYQSIEFSKQWECYIWSMLKYPHKIPTEKAKLPHVDEIECGRWIMFSSKTWYDEWLCRLPESYTATNQPIIVLPRIKITCSICKNIRSPHNPVYANDDCFQSSSNPVALPSGFAWDQVLVLGYSCQSCPESKPSNLYFLVTRKRMKLTLTGRSEFELVEVPKSIPKEISHFFSDAIISHNAGKPLAALFYLRTFIEQHMRRVTGEKGRIEGDVLADKYHSHPTGCS